MLRTLFILAGLVLLSGCTAPTKPYDYSAFRASNPKSILVLPPVNKSPDVKGTHSVMTRMTEPLGKAGYYVMPVAVVDETFKQNGLTSPEDIHSVPASKLHEIFGADAALYVTVNNYGTSYQVINSITTVSASAELVDLRTGKLLWSRSGYASSNEGQSNSGSLLAALVTAAITQVTDSLTDAAHDMAERTAERMFKPCENGCILPGPYSPVYGKDKTAS